MRIEYFDTTLRDGGQSLPEANQFTPGSKPEIADAIASIGIQTIESGFPATPTDAQEVTEVARTVGNKTYIVEPTRLYDGQLVVGAEFQHTPVITGLSRAVHKDIEVTWEAVSYAARPGIHVFVSTDDDHMRVKHPDMTPEDVVTMAVEAVRYAEEISAEATRIEISAEAASSTDPEFLDRCIAEIAQQNVDIINLPDTVGQARPIDIDAMFYMAAQRIITEGREEIILSTHNHNDSGLAVMNSIAAAQGAQRAYEEAGLVSPTFQVEGVMGGLGERAGNTAIEQVVNFVTMHGPQERLIQEIDTRGILQVAETVFAAAGLDIPRQSPIIGSDILKHRSGIHSDGVVKGGAALYTPFDPRWFGHDTAAQIEDGKYQGTRGKLHIGSIDTY